MKTEIYATTLDAVAALRDGEALGREALFGIPFTNLLTRFDCAVSFLSVDLAKLLVGKWIEQKHHVWRIRSANRTHDRSQIARPFLRVICRLACFRIDQQGV